MGPKKSQQFLSGENAWRAIIEQAPLVEDKFTVKVIMIEAAGSDQDRIYLNKFEIFAAEEKRFVIKNICKTETIFMVNQLGGEKKVKDDNFRVFEEGQAYLKDKKPIPPDIQALIIKHLILKMKEEYLFIKRQRLQVKEGMRRESATMLDTAEVRGSVNVKPPEPEPPPPPPKGKGKKQEDDDTLLPEPAEGKKYNTLLRVRGEEWRDKVYVDDFPTDGPHLYVALTGFLEPELAGCLVKIGIPLSAVVQVRIDAATSSVPSSLIRPTKRGQSQTEILTEKSLRFWEDIQFLRINKESADDFKNTAFIVFSPPYWDTESLSGNPDKIYDELCYLMYDVQDLTRQHSHYLENMDIINVPNDILDDCYEKYYHTQIDDLNLECVTIYSVMDSLLQTVSKSQELEKMSSRTSLSTAVTMNHPVKTLEDEEKLAKAEGFVKEVFNTLCKTETNRKAYRLTYGEEYEEHKDPVIINYGDFAKYPTFHLGNINLDNIVWTSLFGMPIHKLWANQDRPHGELEAKINFHVNVLLSCFARQDVETAELNRLIHILACRKLYNNRSSLKKKHVPPSDLTEFKKVYLKRSVLAEPLLHPSSIGRSCSSTSPSFPSMSRSENDSLNYNSNESDPEIRRIKFLFDCPDISELTSAAEIATEKPINHLIDDFDYFEDFSGVSAFQIMHEAFNKFNCVDYKYCSVTDCFVIMFFNSHDKDGISREDWRCHLATPLCLQDFFDFVLEEHYDWIQDEEIIYDKNMLVKTQSEFVFDSNNVHGSCINEIDVQEDLLLEGSLKYQELEAANEASPEPSEARFTTPSKRIQTPTGTDAESKSTKKTKSLITKRQSICPPRYLKPVKPFCGYDLGDRRVEVFGKDATFFSRDGTRILSMYTLIIPMNIEYIIMSVVPGNSYNEFWVHRALGDDITSDIQDSCESFRITTKDQVMINIKKKSYKIPLRVVAMSTPENSKRREMTATSRVTMLSEIFETITFHTLFVTWPNGLITETVYEDNSTAISHVKQYYVSPHINLDEDMRCISLNGEVLVFRPSGDIEVLRPDGSYIRITKYGKRIVVPEESDEQSEVSSDKSKKGKGKDNKPKEKASRGSSKSSKNIIIDDEALGKPIEYELVIDEFETIETSGLRQKWINENSFDIEKLLIRTATDYNLGEVFSRRMDGTHILLNKDGVQVVTFPNKTRIITKYIVEDEEIFPEWTDEEKEYFDMFDVDSVDTDSFNKSKASISQKSGYAYGSSMTSSVNRKAEEEDNEDMERSDGYVSVQIIFTVEHPSFTTVTIDKSSEKISVESPNNTKIIIDANNNYKITLDQVTTADFNGQNLHINYEACPECHSFTSCDIKITSDELSSVTKLQQHWLRMKDSFSKRVIVNGEGGISFVETPYSDEMIINPEELVNPGEESPDLAEDKPFDAKSESSMISHGKCREMYLAKTLRFFVLKRELTCSELIHRALLDQYRKDCRWQPWCSINQYDTFGDNRSLLSLLTPVHLTETEKWLMDSKLANKPKYLTYKDLKKDCGKGFYHWMRPYGRFEPKPMTPENVLPPRLPRAFVLRTLEQQWSPSARESLKGAKELLSAILQYRRVMESDSETLLHVPIVDHRSEDERRIDDVIQALAHRIYEDLKHRLEEDVQVRAKADITTKPPLPPEEMSIEGELEEEPIDEQKLLEEERRSQLAQLEQAEEMSPALKRYWRRRAEELKEEQFYQYLLREGSVPPYFRNVLGGAIWWEMNNTTDDAVSKAERRQMKCVCAEEAPTNPGGDVYDGPFM